MEMAHNQLASSGFPPADVVQEGPLSVSLCVAFRLSTIILILILSVHVPEGLSLFYIIFSF